MKQPLLYLRLEGLAIFLGSILFYAEFGFGWLMFAGLLLIVDLSMLGYVSSPKLGAHIYNIGHSLTLPLVLLIYSYTHGLPLLASWALIWAAHIGMDRALGYGLKFSDSFQHTHLGTIGRQKQP